MFMNFIEYLKEPWPWYIAGPLIGLLVPLLLLFDNKKFGISSTFRDFCAYVVPSGLDYFKYNLKEYRWRNVFVLGIMLGGAVAAIFLSNHKAIAISSLTVSDLKALGISDFSGMVPSEIFSWSGLFSLKGIVFMMVGGFLIGFGTRYADGCTAGHSITGLSLLSPASFIATLGFFAGGLISVHLIFPLLFK